MREAAGSLGDKTDMESWWSAARAPGFGHVPPRRDTLCLDKRENSGSWKIPRWAGQAGVQGTSGFPAATPPPKRPRYVDLPSLSHLCPDNKVPSISPNITVPHA